MIWLVSRAGKIKRILHCDWLPKQDSAILRARDHPLCPTVLFFHIINPLLAKLVHLKWLDIGLVFRLACLFMDLDPVSIHKHDKKTT